MAIGNIITQLQPANNGTLYDIGVFANRVFLGNNLDEDNTLASMLNRFITTDNNGNICIDGYDDNNNNGSIISKGSIDTTDGGSNLQSLLFTDMASRHQTYGIGGNKKSLIFGEGYGSVSNPNTAFGLNNSFIFGIDNNIRCNTNGNTNYPSMSSYLDNPLLSNCGVIGSDNRATCFSTTPTSVAKNSLIVGTNNQIRSYNNYINNTLIFGKNNSVETNGINYNLEAFCAGSNNTVNKSGNVIGNELNQNNITIGGTVVGTYNSRDVMIPIGGNLRFEVGTGHAANNVGESDVRETGFGVGEDNVIYMYTPNNGPVYAFAPTAGGLTLTAWRRNGELITSTNLLSLS